MNEEDYDLYYHALNYRTAASQHAEAAWQELLACHDRLLAREKENTEYGWKNVRILEKAYQDERAKRDSMTELTRELLVMLEKCQHLGYCKAIRGPEDEQWIEEEKCDCGRNAVIAKAEDMLK